MFSGFLWYLVGELPWHGSTVFTYYCIVVKIEYERSLSSWIFRECSIYYMSLGIVSSLFSSQVEGVTEDASSETRCLNISSMSKFLFIVRCKAPKMIGAGSRMIL